MIEDDILISTGTGRYYSDDLVYNKQKFVNMMIDMLKYDNGEKEFYKLMEYIQVKQ